MGRWADGLGMHLSSMKEVPGTMDIDSFTIARTKEVRRVEETVADDGVGFLERK